MQPKTDFMQRVAVNGLSSEQSGPKYSVQIEIFGCPLQCLVDSGSQVNVLPVTSLPNDFDKSKLGKSFLYLRAYNETQIPVIGSFITDIRIETIVVPVCFHVVENRSFSAILGTPFLKDAEINFKQNVLTLKGCKVKLNDYRTKDGDLFNVRQEEKKTPMKVTLVANIDTVVEGHSEVILPAACTTKIEGEALYATCPQSCKIEDMIAAKTASFISPVKSICNIRLINTSGTKKRIKAKEPIIQAEKVIAAEVHQDSSNFNEIKSGITIGTKDENLRASILKLVKNYTDVFATENAPVGRTSKMEFTINTGDSEPISQQRYRTPYYLKDTLKGIINKNIEKGLMEPISSPWAAPTLLVKKPDGQYRLVCDYRRLNEVTAPEHYPLPFIGDLIDNLCYSKIFSVMDLAAGFHQIPCSTEAKQKLAVATDFGQFCWTVMPMGLRNAPSVFQRLMDTIFRHMPSSSLVIYLDDILLHSKETASHLEQLEELFQTLRQNELKLKPSKTVLATDEADFCGFRIKNGCKFKNTKKVEAVRELRPPQNKAEAQKTFGLLSYHRTFIKNFARIAAPIVSSYSSKSHFKWDEQANSAFETLKDLICDAALNLTIPDPNESLFVLETDASETGYGASLMICTDKKEHDDHGPDCLRPIEYLSSQFNEAQKRYYIAEKELFAGRAAMNKWSHYLLGRQFLWYTDNSVFRWASRVRSTNQKISKWLAEISEFQFKSILRSTTKMKISDCLSRTINSITIRPPELTLLQENDALLKIVRNHVRQDRWPLHPTSSIKFFKLRRSKLRFGENQELIFQNESGPRIIAPKSLQREILQTHHDEAGHPGIDQTRLSIESTYLWEDLDSHIRLYIQSCESCQRGKPNNHPHIPSQGLSSTPKMPYEAVSFDLIGPLGITRSDNRYILVGVDQFSKKLYTAALPSKASSLVGDAIRNVIYSIPKTPKEILTDNGLEFTEVSAICDVIGAKHRKSPAYRPQTNGLCERNNQTLKNRLFIGQHDPDWENRLARTTHQINSSTSMITGFSAFEIETGFKGDVAVDHLARNFEQSNPCENQEKARERITKEKEIRFEKFKRPDFIPFAIGALVLTKNKIRKHPRYLGPYKVKIVKGEGKSYILECMETSQLITRHASELKPFVQRSSIFNSSDPAPDNEKNDEEMRSEKPTGTDAIDSDWEDFITSDRTTFAYRPSIPVPASQNEPERVVSVPFVTTCQANQHDNTVKFNARDSDEDVCSDENEAANELALSREVIDNTSDNNDSDRTKNIFHNQSCRRYSQDSLASTNSQTAGNTIDYWIEDQENFSQQSEHDRRQADANFREISTFLDDLSNESFSTREEQSYEFLEQQEHTDNAYINTDADSVTTSGETDYETAGEDSQIDTPDKEVQDRYKLRDRNTLKRPSRLIEVDSDTEEIQEEPARKTSDASLISVVPVDSSNDTVENDSSKITNSYCDNQTDFNTDDDFETDVSADEGERSNRWSGISITLEEMEKRQLKLIASKNGLQTNSNKSELRKAIDKHFAEQYPDWRRNTSNQLVFKRKLEIEKPTPIAVLSKKELRTVAQFFGKHHICDKSGFTFKVEWRNALNQFLRNEYPTAQLDKNQLIILTPDMFGKNQ